jgi:hypothetical protein
VVLVEVLYVDHQLNLVCSQQIIFLDHHQRDMYGYIFKGYFCWQSQPDKKVPEAIEAGTGVRNYRKRAMLLISLSGILFQGNLYMCRNRLLELPQSFNFR